MRTPRLLRKLVPDRRRTRLLAIVVALALVAGGTGAWAWLGRERSDTSTAITATVARGTYKDTVTGSGTITPVRQADLSFSSSGTVTAVEVEPGDRVQEGDVLARIDATSLQAQRDAAAAQVDAAEAQVSEDADASSAQKASSSAALSSARSQLEQAQQALDAAALTAPFGGVVSAVGYDVGDVVGGGGGGASSGSASTPAITLITPKRLQVEATVAAADVERVKKGLQVEVTPAGSSAVVYGTVAEVGVIAGASETGAAQFPVTITITGKPSGLYAGASATVAITVRQATDVLAVPTGAVRSAGDKTYVYVLAGGKRKRQDVKLGQAYGAQTEVLSGLEEGDVVEVASFRRPSGGGNGGQVRIPDGFQGGFPGGTQGGVPGGGPVVIERGP